MNFWQARLGCILIALWLSGCAVAPALPPEQRPRDWAQQVGSVPLRTDARLPNLYQVSPVLYRSAQPGVEGLDILNRQLARNHGLPTEIKTVISLRNNAGDEALVKPVGIRYEQIRFNTWDVREEDVVRFLALVRNPKNQPVLLHCKHGADRTGMMVAIYRIVEQGWSKEAAIAEMTQGGFGYHPIWSNLTRYIRKMDVQTLKEKVAQFER